MRSTFIEPSDSRWADVIRRVPHDIYHIPNYTAVSAQYACAQPIAFYAASGEDICLIPLLLSKVPSEEVDYTWEDAVSPYGYASPLFIGGQSWVNCAFAAFQRACSADKIVTAFLRMHPLMPVSTSAPNVVEARRGETVYADLSLPVNDVWTRIRKGHRTDIQRLTRLGFESVVDDWSTFEDFTTIYLDTMHRLGAAAGYRFPREYFHDMRGRLDGALHLITVRAPDGETAAAGLFMEHGGIVQYHLSGTTAKHTHAAPSKLMLHTALLWAQERGNRYLHFGGGLGGAPDSLFQFKAGFSPLRATFRTLHVICDPAEYEHLVTVRNLPDDSPNDFFPAYRKPV